MDVEGENQRSGLRHLAERLASLVDLNGDHQQTPRVVSKPGL